MGSKYVLADFPSIDGPSGNGCVKLAVMIEGAFTGDNDVTSCTVSDETGTRRSSRRGAPADRAEGGQTRCLFSGLPVTGAAAGSLSLSQSHELEE